ncbi:hypothetical protein AKO1_003834 [Acrasis kona]|uniref:Ubiquitin-like protease family profile domain-containing protein n=1 Tax=Acrasis kona TaxID=1008807 RepID=A0AAW2Z683_9EUKA
MVQKYEKELFPKVEDERPQKDQQTANLDQPLRTLTPIVPHFQETSKVRLLIGDTTVGSAVVLKRLRDDKYRVSINEVEAAAVNLDAPNDGCKMEELIGETTTWEGSMMCLITSAQSQPTQVISNDERLRNFNNIIVAVTESQKCDSTQKKQDKKRPRESDVESEDETDQNAEVGKDDLLITATPEDTDCSDKKIDSTEPTTPVPTTDEPPKKKRKSDDNASKKHTIEASRNASSSKAPTSSDSGVTTLGSGGQSEGGQQQHTWINVKKYKGIKGTKINIPQKLDDLLVKIRNLTQIEDAILVDDNMNAFEYVGQLTHGDTYYAISGVEYNIKQEDSPLFWMMMDMTPQQDTVGTYLKRMAVSGWGGCSEIAAAAHLYKANIKVYTNSKIEQDCFPEYIKIIPLHYNGLNHYEC